MATYTDNSIFAGIMEFTTANATSVRVIDCGNAWDIYTGTHDTDAYVRCGRVRQLDGDTPRAIWERWTETEEG